MSGCDWTDKEDQLMRDHYPHNSIRELRDLFSDRTDCSIYNRANTLDLKKSDKYLEEHRPGWFNKGKRNSKATEFKKGHDTWNKDSIGLTGRNKTSFKKGHKPHNRKKKGTITVRNDSSGRPYLYYKLDDADWVLYHRHIYEKEVGPIPDKHCVVFKDDNTFNVHPDNLECISMAENAIRNQNGKKGGKTRSLINQGKIKPKPLTNYQVLRRICGDDEDLKEYIKEHRPDIIRVAKKNFQLKRKMRYETSA